MKETNHAKQALKNILISGTCFIMFLLGCSAPKNIIVPYDELISVDVYEEELQQKLNPEYDAYSLVHSFPYGIEDIAINYPEKKVLLLLGKERYNPNLNQGVLVYYDLENQKILWTKQSYKWEYKEALNDLLWLDYSLLNIEPVFLDDEILFYAKDKIFSIDKETGHPIWEREVESCILDTSNMIAFTGELVAFDLKTGQNMWEKDIKNKFGVTDIINDSTHILLAANGLHRFSLENGAGWSIKMSTGRTNETGTVFANIGLALLSGGNSSNSSYIEPDIWTGMCSNVLLNNDTIYFSAKSDFNCIELNSGNIIWETQFPERQVGYTDLIEDSKNILVINNGFNLKNGYLQEKYGTPFIAKYNKLNGEEIFYVPIPTENYIGNFEIKSDTIILLTEKELFCYTTSGELRNEFHVGNTKYEEQFGDLYSIADKSYRLNNSYIKLNTTYESLTSQFNESIIIRTIEGYLEFDENFKISRFWPDSIITMNYYNTKEYSFCQQRDAAYWDLDYKIFDIERDMRWALMQNNTRKYLMKKEELHQFLEKHPQLYEYDTFDKNNNYVGKIDIKEHRYSIDGVIYSLSKNKIIETHILVDN